MIFCYTKTKNKAAKGSATMILRDIARRQGTSIGEGGLAGMLGTVKNVPPKEKALMLDAISGV